jgi:hypothetical protein
MRVRRILHHSIEGFTEEQKQSSNYAPLTRKPAGSLRLFQIFESVE